MVEKDSIPVLESEELALNLSLCFEKSELSSVDKVAVFILLYLQKRFPYKWCGGSLKEPLSCVEFSDHRKHGIWQDVYTLAPLLNETFRYCTKKLKVSQEDALLLPIVDVFSKLRLSCIRHNGDNYVNKFIVEWTNNNRKVCLMCNIPTPWEVLTQQAHGERVVTMFVSSYDLAKTHISKLTYMSGEREHERDAFAFLLHDIRHMEHFFVSDIYYEQVGFFRCCLEWREMKHVMTKLLCHPKSLWHELEYVFSDMNCYSTHLLRYFHAKWLHSFQLIHKGSSLEQEERQQQPSRLQADEEWRFILELLLLPKLHEEGLPTIEIISPPSLHSKREQVISIAMKLNLVSSREIRGLEVEEWEYLRGYFADIGRTILK